MEMATRARNASGLAVGLLVWVQMPPQYLAVARIQVVTPRGTDLPFNILDDGNSIGLGRTDDVVIIQSLEVLKKAIEIGRLIKIQSLPTNATMN